MPTVLGRKPGGAGGGGAPSGPAGGDLGGTYPNPTVPNLIPKTLVDAKGDLLVGTAADTVARVAVGATNGMVLEAASGATPGVQWDLPVGHEFDYAQITADVSITATVEASAVNIVVGNSVAYDGSTVVMIEFWAAGIQTVANSNTVLVNLWEDSTDLGTVAQYVSTAFFTAGVHMRVRRTPTAGSHTYTIKGWRTTNNGVLLATSATYLPAFIRVTKV